MILVPLDSLAAKLPDADSTCPQVVRQLASYAFIRLSLPLQGHGIGPATHFLAFGLAINLVSNPPDISSELASIDTTDLVRSFLERHKYPKRKSHAEPKPRLCGEILDLRKPLNLW